MCIINILHSTSACQVKESLISRKRKTSTSEWGMPLQQHLSSLPTPKIVVETSELLRTRQTTLSSLSLGENPQPKPNKWYQTVLQAQSEQGGWVVVWECPFLLSKSISSERHLALENGVTSKVEEDRYQTHIPWSAGKPPCTLKILFQRGTLLWGYCGSSVI